VQNLPPVVLDTKFLLPTESGDFDAYGFLVDGANTPIIALANGAVETSDWPLVRLQSRCDTSEVFGSKMCDCAEQLRTAMQRVQAAECGLIIHLDQEGRGNGLRAKLQIYQLMQTQGLTSGQACAVLHYPVDARVYDQAAAILYALNVNRVRLLTNNPSKVEGLRSFGIEVQQENIRIMPNVHNHAYLLDKQVTHKHDLGL
jgi:3,4-dihydroxy 2-butanone 4-phosphate synthase/GTP cyclohydrolase II